MKLVRDNIPAIATVRKFRQPLDKVELMVYAAAKIKEEAQEVITAKTKEEITEELADLREIMLKYAELNGIQWDDVLDKAAEKNKEKGRFDDNWIMER